MDTTLNWYKEILEKVVVEHDNKKSQGSGSVYIRNTEVLLSETLVRG